jgi:hypothetical protein
VLATSIPTALLIVPAIHPSDPASYVSVLIVATVSVAAVAAALARWVGPPIRASLLLLGLTLLLDLLLGGTAIARSILSDFPASGMRFYGIGNEYMGLLVAGLIAAAGWSERDGQFPSRLPLAVMGLATAWIVGHPAYGADFGGALAAIAGFGVAWMAAGGRRLDVRWIGMLAGVLVLVGIGLLSFDAMRPEAARSHLGDLGRRAVAEGPSVLLAVAGRKLGMNWRILQNPWFVLSLAVLAFASIACYHGLGAHVRAAWDRRADLRGAVAGIVAAGLVGLVANDSGVVMAGYVACVLIALLVAAVLEGVRVGAGP